MPKITVSATICSLMCNLISTMANFTSKYRLLLVFENTSLCIMGIGLSIKSGVTVLKNTYFLHLNNGLDEHDTKKTSSEVGNCKVKPWSIRY